jgi:ABC-type nitrate/sulfonate/bicarbonate transport system substrate-binding protein
MSRWSGGKWLVPILITMFVAVSCSDDGGGQAGGDGETSANGEPVTIRYAFDWLACEGGWAPLFWGRDLGYFDEENIVVEETGYEGSAAALPFVAAGEEDMGQIQASTLVLGTVEELPVTAAGVYQYESPLVILTDGSIQGPEDLEGSEIAVQHGQFETAVWQAWTKKVGVDRSKVTENPAGGNAFPLFLDHRVDGFIWYYPSTATPVLTDGREGDETIIPVQDLLPTYGLALAVNNSFLEENPEAVRGFMRAWARGIQQTISDPGGSVDLLLENCPDLDPAGAEFSVNEFIRHWTADQAQTGGIFSFEESGWDATKKVLVDGGLMEERDITSLYTTDYLPDPPIYPEA